MFRNNHGKMIPKYPNGPLKVMELGRVSTLKQQKSNIDASYDYAEQILKDVYEGTPYIKRLGSQESGMLVERETIMEACKEIATGTWDLVLLEDVSRAYRNPRWIYAFVQDCVDHDTRVIAPGDNLDTWDENWEITLGAAALRHGMHVPDTRRRVRRTAAFCFQNGGMVLHVKFGYRKVSKEEAASGQFGPVGLRVTKRAEDTAIIRTLRLMIVRDRVGPQALSDWLNEQGVETGPSVKHQKWTAALVSSLLRDPILYGLRRHQQVIHELRFKDGRHTRRKNLNPDSKHWPELAHMTEEQWREMNAVLNDLSSGTKRRTGVDHPRHRVRRKDSFCGLQHCTCSVCREFLWVAGNNVIKCQNSVRRTGATCWNHVLVNLPLMRAKLVDLLLSVCQRHPAAMETMLKEVWQEVSRAQGRSQHEVETATAHIQKLEAQGKNLAESIALGGKLDLLVAQVKIVQAELKKARKQREALLNASEAETLPLTEEQVSVTPAQCS